MSIGGALAAALAFASFFDWASFAALLELSPVEVRPPFFFSSSIYFFK